ncbi:MAG: NAD-dependent epimerase [Methylocystis sp.]
MRIFVTGAAGFIGFHLSRRLLELGHQVDGYDGMTAYYDVRLKQARLAILLGMTGFRPHIAMLEDMSALERAAEIARPDVIVHLAAQAGVRYSLENPRAYVDSNLVGGFNLLEIARTHPVRHLLMASTSSVYGANPDVPFREAHKADHPLTLYAATKKANEAMAHSYSHLWAIPTTMFRFFTVYGPWGRPDMALFKFVEAIEAGQPIDIYNHGKMARDFTYIDDLVEAVVRLMDCPPERPSSDPATSPVAPWRVVNIGRGEPLNLLEFIEIIERKLGRKAIRNYLDMQKGDVPRTYADSALLERLTGYRPETGAEEGVSAFVDWYRDYRARGESSAH